MLLSKKARKSLFREVAEVEHSGKEVVDEVIGSKDASMEAFKTAAVHALKNVRHI